MEFKDKILILDGAMGTMLQKHSLSGNSECFNFTHPEIIKKIHREYIEAGADIIETNTFSANAISQAEYGCAEKAYEMAFTGARLAREAAEEAMSQGGRKVLVAGSMGPTSKSLSLSPDVSDAAFRNYSFDEMSAAFKVQAQGLIEGGADLILIETNFDALNTKAALSAITEISREKGLERPFPVIVSVSVADRSGRTLTGQKLEAFYTSVCHYPLTAFGLNCSLGAAEMTPLVEEINRWCRCPVICYPNAGLPNEMGGYDQSPEEMAKAVASMARKGLLNIAGGCCGTTPAHIKAVAEAVHDIPARPLSSDNKEDRRLKASGLEAVTVDVRQNNFTNVGERTNVAGSRKFARLIAEGDYDTALKIAAKQIEDGASIIDINMDDAMLDGTKEMERFVRHISNDPSVAKAALMIDSSHWDTILAGLKNAQGKCIVNSISLKEGEDAFVEKALKIKEFGAAIVVMAFDEEGQATTYDRKIEICQRAYRLLTEKAGVEPTDIIFDVNILSIGTGIAEHSRYAIDFIEAVRWIKENLPGALTSGGVSNLSFAFRGNNKVREAMHSAFLYHAIRAGLDMAIVNPSMLQIYDDIEPELLKAVEDVIFDTDEEATERLIAKAQEILEEVQRLKEGGAEAPKETEEKEKNVEERLKAALLKGGSESLEADIMEAMEGGLKAVDVIEGPLMAGMEEVGKRFGEGKMFLPQVVKSAKVMREAVTILQPYLSGEDKDKSESSQRKKVVIATVKGDVHDIGKNITAIVLTCNGFEVHDLGVMVDKETILEEAERLDADIVAVSGLITPSLYQMEEICREMSARGMTKPLFIGGATTSAVHTAVKLAPLYDHVYYGSDASASAVMAKKYIMDPETFETEQHSEQQKLRDLYYSAEKSEAAKPEQAVEAKNHFDAETYLTEVSDYPADIPVMELRIEDVIEYFDWKMFYAIWGVKYGEPVIEVAQLTQLRGDAEIELVDQNYKIRIAARFLPASSLDNGIEVGGKVLPMLRQESGDRLSLCDYVVAKESGKESVTGVFAISVEEKEVHTEGCHCPACTNQYDSMIARTVRLTLAEAASSWLDAQIAGNCDKVKNGGAKVIKPAAGYSSCPDHSLKQDILELIPDSAELKIGLTESYAMIPDAAICGMIFIHPEAKYPEIRRISREQYDNYADRRGFSDEKARKLLSHILG